MRHRRVAPAPEAAFQVLADPTRRAMLDLLRGGSRAAGEIAHAFPVSRPAISRHPRLPPPAGRTRARPQLFDAA